MVGKFLNSTPPKPDQIFNVQYRVINGTMESFDLQQEIEDVLMNNGIVAKVNSSSNGVFEIKFPRNFPYTNSGGGVGDLAFFVVDEDGYIEDNRAVTDCFFAFSVPFKGSIEIEMGLPSILIKAPYHGDSIPDSCTPQTTVQDVPVRKDGTIAPWQQFKAGVAAKDIVCREGFEPIVHPDGRPFCATPNSKEKLQERWNL